MTILLVIASLPAGRQGAVFATKQSQEGLVVFSDEKSCRMAGVPARAN